MKILIPIISFGICLISTAQPNETKNFHEPRKKSELNIGDEALTTGTRIIIRDYPSLKKWKTLGYLDKGEKVTVLEKGTEKVEIDGKTHNWIKTKSKNLVGWSTDRLFIKTQTEIEKKVDLKHSSPYSNQGTIVGEYSKGPGTSQPSLKEPQVTERVITKIKIDQKIVGEMILSHRISETIEEKADRYVVFRNHSYDLSSCLFKEGLGEEKPDCKIVWSSNDQGIINPEDGFYSGLLVVYRNLDNRISFLYYPEKIYQKFYAWDCQFKNYKTDCSKINFSQLFDAAEINDADSIVNDSNEILLESLKPINSERHWRVLKSKRHTLFINYLGNAVDHSIYRVDENKSEMSLVLKMTISNDCEGSGCSAMAYIDFYKNTGNIVVSSRSYCSSGTECSDFSTRINLLAPDGTLEEMESFDNYSDNNPTCENVEDFFMVRPGYCESSNYVENKKGEVALHQLPDERSKELKTLSNIGQLCLIEKKAKWSKILTKDKVEGWIKNSQLSF